MAFKIGQHVTHVLSDKFVGVITCVKKFEAGRNYIVSHFDNNGQPTGAEFNEFELRAAPENNAMGFNKKG